MKNNCIRRIKIAIKNAQRNGDITLEMAKYGFFCSSISMAWKFYYALVRCKNSKRRRSFFRVGRAALKNNDLFMIGEVFPFLGSDDDKFNNVKLNDIPFYKKSFYLDFNKFVIKHGLTNVNFELKYDLAKYETD